MFDPISSFQSFISTQVFISAKFMQLAHRLIIACLLMLSESFNKALFYPHMRPHVTSRHDDAKWFIYFLKEIYFFFYFTYDTFIWAGGSSGG